MNLHWTMLVIAGIFETAFAICLGKARGTQGIEFTGWIAGFVVCLAASMFLLYRAVQVIPVGTAYAIWTGIGATGTVVAGIIFLKEPAHFWRLFFLTALIMSIIGLKITAPPTPD